MEIKEKEVTTTKEARTWNIELMITMLLQKRAILEVDISFLQTLDMGQMDTTELETLDTTNKFTRGRE